VVSALAVAGCAARRPFIEIGGYYFEFEGRTYRIESVNPNSGVGYNVLAVKDGNRNVALGLDMDQDGFLDGIVEGEITLLRARVIYNAGIAEGERQGRIKSRVLTQEYRTTVGQYTCILVTYHLAIGDIFNRLSLVNTYYAPVEAVLLDQGADGRLDRIEQGDRELDFYQAIYDQVIQNGLTYGRIANVQGKYQVIQ
jgi:hypothetical protein